MKYLLIFFALTLAYLPLAAQTKTKEAILATTCTCIGKAIDEEHDIKFDFEFAFGNCLDSLKIDLVQLDKKYSSTIQVNQFIHSELKENCNRYEEVDSIQAYYSSHAVSSIASKKDCEIMKSGVFIEYGDKDSTKIIMSKNEQKVEYADGTYSKSKIEWLNGCSYKVIRIESSKTNDPVVPPGHEMQVNIVYVKDGKIIFYEILMNNKVYSGRMIKIKE